MKSLSRLNHSVISTQPGERLPRPALLSGRDWPSNDGESAGVRELAGTVRQRWRLLAACAVSGVLAALLAGHIQTPVYRAQAALEVQMPNLDFRNAKDGSIASHETVTQPFIETQMKILQSGPVL